MCECEKEKGERLARGVWYYDQPLPEGRKNDTAPIQFILVARMNGSLIVAANPWFEGD
jgi:hypothetical protein